MPDTKSNSKPEQLLEQALALPKDKREWLVDRIINSLADDPGYYPSWHRKAVAEGTAELDANPKGGRSGEEAIAYVRTELERRRTNR